jgi:hypothetical protein
MGVVVREFTHQAAQHSGRLFQQVEAIESVVFRHAIYPTIFPPAIGMQTFSVCH